MFKNIKSIESKLKITGIIVLGIGVLIGFANLMGWLRYNDRKEFLNWARESTTGMSIKEPAGQAFMERFPPPEAERSIPIIGINMKTLSAGSGPHMQASIRYRCSDGSYTSFVATLPDVREWAAESPYHWLAWVLSAIGFLAVLGSYLIQRRRERANI